MKISTILKEVTEERFKFNISLPQEVYDLRDVFKTNGFNLFLVGGSIRDALVGEKPKDFDLATDAKPDEVKKMVSSLGGYHFIEVGESFNIVMAIAPSGEQYEIATFRLDKGKGRRPDAVEFTTIDKDVLRRDFTINALFYDLNTGEVVDLVGGVSDLKNGIIRAVGDPVERFDDDRLRILRAIRFAGRLGAEIDSETDAALKKDSKLSGVSANRIRDEFVRGIESAKSSKQFLSLISKYKLFRWVFPSLNINRSFIETNNPVVLIASLLKNNSTPKVKKILNYLTYTNDEVNEIVFLINFLGFDVSGVAFFKDKFNRLKINPDNLIEFSKLMILDMNTTNKFIDFDLSVSGKDVMDDGFKGKEIGDEKSRRESELFQNFL